MTWPHMPESTWIECIILILFLWKNKSMWRDIMWITMCPHFPARSHVNQLLAKLDLEIQWDLAFYHLSQLHVVDCLQDVDHVWKHVDSKQT